MKFLPIDVHRPMSYEYRTILFSFSGSFWKIAAAAYEKIFLEHISNDMINWIEERNYKIFVTSNFDYEKDIYIHDFSIFLNEEEKLEYLLRWH